VEGAGHEGQEDGVAVLVRGATDADELFGCCLGGVVGLSLRLCVWVREWEGIRGAHM
jgi:hypothetical protein